MECFGMRHVQRMYIWIAIPTSVVLLMALMNALRLVWAAWCVEIKAPIVGVTHALLSSPFHVARLGTMKATI